MIIVNLVKVTKTYFINGNEVTVPPLGKSPDLILTVDNVRNIYSTGRGKIKFEVTNPLAEMPILSEAGVKTDDLIGVDNSTKKEVESQVPPVEEVTEEVAEPTDEPKEEERHGKRRKRRSKKSE